MSANQATDSKRPRDLSQLSTTTGLRALPFILHILIEVPASINFFVNPNQQLQLSAPSPMADAVIRQYATLLFVSAIIAFVCVIRPIDVTSQRIAGSLALYHLAPLARAASRLLQREAGLEGGLGGPLVHATVHSACFTTLFALYIA